MSVDKKGAVVPDSNYSRYVLCVLVVVASRIDTGPGALVYMLNFLDRQILSILAEDIKADLGVSDAHIGFLYGIAFAVFYAVFGIPMGRLADNWIRTRLIAVGLPGIAVATWVATLREPKRGISEGADVTTDARPFRAMVQDLLAIVPPFNLWSLARHNGGGRAVAQNIGLSLVPAAVLISLAAITHTKQPGR